MKHNRVLLNRLKENIGDNRGCSQLFLKVLKSDLARLLGQYMAFEGLELAIIPNNDRFDMQVQLNISQFFELGKGVE
ncbi:MAG: hypothetical protein FWE03_02205 [Firmicutes bacterium]|nr:hypothetical protein [Bacillota bacterium]